MSALGITEHGNVHGWLEFYDACKAVGIKPILGMEAYQARKTRHDRDDEERAGRAADEWEQRGPHHLTLLAKNETGYKNIIKLSSRAFLEGYYVKPRLDFELLQDHGEGVIILSGCLSGKIQQAFMRGDPAAAYAAADAYQQAVGKENFYIEIMRHGLPEEERMLPLLIKMAKDLGVPLVPTGDCHYVHKNDAMAHDHMLCVSTNATIEDENRFKFFNDQFYLKSYDEMAKLFEPEWLENTMQIAEQVELDLQFGEMYFPEFPLPPDRDVNEYLTELVWDGVKQRYPDWEQREDVKARVDHELGVVARMGFQSYFLVVSDLVRWAKANGIRVGWGRGSAAGSILSYVLEITNLDPLRFGLLFERFLVEGRKSMPDIDLDFDDARRQEVIDYARSRYGDDRVAHIATFTKVGARTAIKDAARVLGYPFSEGDRLSKMLPAPVLGISKSIDESLQLPELRKEYEANEDARKIIDTARGLEGLVRQTGLHAAGVVIARSDLMDYIPVMRTQTKDGKAGPIITQWDMVGAERVGLLKIDFLGLRNLRVIDKTLEMVKTRRNIEVDIYDGLDIDDAATYEALRNGASMGVFQLESEGMRKMMLALQPSQIEDIMALVSLYRPGPLGSGMDQQYIARKHGREPVRYAHPKLAAALESSHGIMLYQEDVLAVARELAGFSVGEADDLRKVIGKKLMDQISKYRSKFVEGAKQTSGVTDAVANRIYSEIEYFGGYGFNRAHAASYAMVSFVTAYLKVHFPAEYMAALLSSVVDKPDRAARYLSECRQMGITVNPPSVNESIADFRVLNDEAILYGLSMISGIGDSKLQALLDRSARFRTVYDWLRTCNVDALDKRTLEHLMGSGALDELVGEQPDQVVLRSDRMAVLAREREELGLYITEHPLVGVWHLVEPMVNASVTGLDDLFDGNTVALAGVIVEMVKKNTRRGDVMYRLQLEDLSGVVEVLMFPKQAAEWGEQINPGDIVIVEGRLTKEGDEDNSVNKIILSNILVPDLPEHGAGEPIYLELAEHNSVILKSIRQIIEDNPGDSPVYIRVKSHPHLLVFRFQKPTHAQVRDRLCQLVNLDNLANEVFHYAT